MSDHRDIGSLNPVYKSNMRVTPQFSINHTCKKPNWWWRFWQYIMFGFKWEDMKEYRSTLAWIIRKI